MSDVPIVVPEGKEATDLTMGELDAASYHMGADVLEAVAGQVPGKRYGALVEIAVVWARRNGATESREILRKQFRDYQIEDMFRALRMTRTEPAAEPDPTSSSDESNGPSSLESSAGSPETSTGSTP